MNSRNPLGSRNATLSILLACAAIGGAAGIATAQAAPAMPASSSGMRATSVFGTTGSGPNSITIDSAGNVYTSN